jgi:SanA protein
MPDARPRRWLKRGLIVSGMLVALVGAGNLWVHLATSGKQVDSVEAAPSRPVVIVLGSLVFPSGRPSAELAERLETARALYRAGRASRIVVSGRAYPGYDEARAMADWLQAHGVPAADVEQDGGGHRTAATMANAAAQGIRAALIATQGYHLPRALYLAERAGIDAVGVPARATRRSGWQALQNHLREALARAEIVVEVLVRGVRA